MKKVFTYLILGLICFWTFSIVKASSYSVKLVGDDTFTKEITLNVQVNDLGDFDGNCKGLCGLAGKLMYDSEKLELVSMKALNKFDLTTGGKFVLYKTTGVKSGTKILEIKFKNKGLSKNETTKISLEDLVASDGNKDITTENVSKEIKYVVNTVTKSNNNYLKSLSVDVGSLSFSKDVLSYEVNVPYETNKIKISAEKEHNKAVVSGIGEKELNVGSNSFKVTVTAEDKTTRVYNINVTREKEVVSSDDNNNAENNNTNNNVNEDNKDKNPEKETKDNKKLIPFVIGGLVLVISIILIVIVAKKNKEEN